MKNMKNIIKKQVCEEYLATAAASEIQKMMDAGWVLRMMQSYTGSNGSVFIIAVFDIEISV